MKKSCLFLSIMVWSWVMTVIPANALASFPLPKGATAHCDNAYYVQIDNLCANEGSAAVEMTSNGKTQTVKMPATLGGTGVIPGSSLSDPANVDLKNVGQCEKVHVNCFFPFPPDQTKLDN